MKLTRKLRKKKFPRLPGNQCYLCHRRFCMRNFIEKVGFSQVFRSDIDPPLLRVSEKSQEIPVESVEIEPVSMQI